ncbi:TAXI family TRAP transporter solute-binding subunit [Nocardia sp. NPDC056100]|uniref:TAXI family TRAP transporter solute-binding subunit n=1 Tax=Nocardia sp. NPDC056100 TaxID=3345712 RepID=UPI0035DE591B
MIGRRGFLRGAGALTAGTVLSGTLGGCASDETTVRMAAGESGGFYYAFAQLLSRTAAGSGVRIEVVSTAGSVDNLELLARGGAEVGLVLADSVADSADPPPAIGRVYENYLQVAVAADGPIRSPGDMRGARINVGATGSGAAHTGEKLLSAAGLSPAEVTATHLPLAEAVTALRQGRIDALLWAGGVPTPALAEPGVRLLDLGSLTEPMRERFGYLYDPVLIPAGTYPGSPAVHTIGVANLLVAAPALADSTARALTEVLLAHADSLVPAEAAGTQFLDARSLIGTGTVPLHPGAAAAYRRHHG